MININTQTKTIQILTFVLTFLGINTTFSQILNMPGNGETCVSTAPVFVFDGTSGNATVEVLDCDIPNIGLSDYTLQNTFLLDMNPINAEDDLSGITYNPNTNTLFAVTNGGNVGSLFEAIYEVDLNGNIINTFNLVDTDDGISTSEYFEDTEGIVYLYGRTFAIVQEYKGNIAIIDLPMTSGDIYHSDADIIELPGAWLDNNGLEGISYDPIANQFHVVKEKLSKKYYVVDMPTVFPTTATQTTYTEHDLLLSNAQEAAGMHYMGLTARFADTDAATHRLIVDEKGKKIVEIDANYQIVDELLVPEFKYEGITMDNNGTIYMVQEPNKIHVYTNPDLPGVIHSVTVSENGYFMPSDVLAEGTEYCWRVIDSDGSISDTHSFTTIGTMTICAGISSGANDVEELHDGNMYFSSTDIELIYDTNANRKHQKIGLRYEDLGIPQGATITSAYLQFTTDETSTGAVNLTIQGEDTDHASPFATTNGNLSARPTTQAAVAWSPPTWNVEHEQGTKQQTPELTTILQEIVDRNGFDQNSAVALIISGSGTNSRVAESFEGSPELAPQLCVTFTPESCEGDTCVEANISLWLEGAYDETGDTMRTGLRTHAVLPEEIIGTNPVPGGQPYDTFPWYYPGTEGLGWQMDDYDSTVVDWVLVSFRTDPAASSEVFKAAALLHSDGDVHFVEQCALPDSLYGEHLYIVVDHRNQLVVMSDTAIPPAVTATTNGDEYSFLMYDFRQQNSYQAGSGVGQKQLPNGEWALFTGDMDGNYDINGADNSIRFAQNGLSGQYMLGDNNLDADVNGADKGLWSNNSGYSSAVPQ